MNREPSTFGLGSEKLARVFGLGVHESSELDSPVHDDIEAELLCDLLAQSLPCRDAGEINADDVSHTLDALAGDSLRDLLLDSQTDVSLLREIKAYGAALTRDAQAEAPCRSATTLYYAAIASALVHHGVRITGLSWQELADAWEKLGEQDWMPDSLRRLFEEGERLCRDKTGA